MHGANDTGGGLHVTVTAAEEAAVRARLAAAGLPVDALRHRTGSTRRNRS
ncbi:hypothetical protein [Kitasatospora sp. NPDC056184]